MAVITRSYISEEYTWKLYEAEACATALNISGWVTITSVHHFLRKICTSTKLLSCVLITTPRHYQTKTLPTTPTPVPPPGETGKNYAVTTLTENTVMNQDLSPGDVHRQHKSRKIVKSPIRSHQLKVVN